MEQQAELRSAEASRRLGALDLRMSGVQGGLGEHKRDILKLREEVNGLTVKSASHEVDIQKNGDAVGIPSPFPVVSARFCRMCRCGRWRSSGTWTSRTGRQAFRQGVA